MGPSYHVVGVLIQRGHVPETDMKGRQCEGHAEGKAVYKPMRKS